MKVAEGALRLKTTVFASGVSVLATLRHTFTNVDRNFPVTSSRVYFTSAEVTGFPSWNLAFLRRLNW